jgi:RHS repeat-associated protein
MLAANVVESAAAAFMSDAARFRNDVASSALTLVNAIQPSPTNTPSPASMAKLWNKVESVLAADWGQMQQAFVQFEDAVLAAYQQEFDALLAEWAGLLPPQTPSPSPFPPGSGAGSGGSGTANGGNPGNGVHPPSKSNNDPLYVLDMNTGETIPANATLNTFSTWSENPLAQVSGGAVQSYSWNVSQAPDLTNVSGTTTANLQGTWASFTGPARTDTISVTETPQVGQAQTQTITFVVAGTNSPAFSSSRPTSNTTWPTVITPDQMTSNQETVPGGPYARLGLADGSLQTSFSMPSYNPNTAPVSLDYNSTVANAQPIFLDEYQLPSGQSVPSTITAQLTFNGTALSTVMYNTSGLNPGDIVQIGLQANATGLTTGRYPWSITVTNNGTPTTYNGNVNIVNQANSPFGAGWSLDNVEQLFPVTGGVILVEPGGTSLWFASNGQGNFTSPADDFSTLVQNQDNSYTRTMTDGTKINFNSSGQETSTVDRDGNTTTFGYTSGQLTSITDMNGQVTTLAYSSGLLSSITDPANRTATLSYTGKQLTSITDPGSDVWQYSYDSANDLTKLTDPNNHATAFTYDFADRVSSVTQPDSSTLQLAPVQVNGLAAPGTGTPSNPAASVLLATGSQASFTDGNGHVWTTGTDWLGLGQDVADIDPLGDASLNYINANGLTWMSSDALARRTREFFDSKGNPTEIVNADDSYATYQYNSFAEPTQYTNEIGAVTTYTYNSKGDLTQETNALNETTTYAYNTAGLVTSMTNANNNTWTYSYDTLNRKTGETDPLKYTQSWQYDSAGDLTQYTDQNGNVSTYADNAMGWMTSKTLPDTSGVTSTYTYTYDKVGNQLTETIPITATQTATTTDTYDAMNRLSTETDPLGDLTKYTYDNNGNQIAVTNPLGYVTTNTYDAANRQTGTTIPLSGSGQNQVTATTTFGYDAAGEQTSKTDAMGDLWQYTYNSRGWMSSSTDPMQNKTTYGYDAVGDQTSVTDALGDTTQYSYDSIGEKTTVIYPDGGLSVGTNTWHANVTGTFSGGYSSGSSSSTAGTLTGEVFNSANQEIGTVTGKVVGSVDVSILPGGIITGTFSGNGEVVLSGAVSGCGWFSFLGEGWQGTNNGNGSGTFSGSVGLSMTGNVDSNYVATAPIGGLASVSLSGGGSCSTTPYGTFDGYALQNETYGYDKVGNLTSDSIGTGCSCGGSGPMTYGYNADNERTSMTEADGSQYTYSYDGVGNQTQVVNPLGYATNYTYDAQGRLLAETNALGGKTSYGYNLAGWQTSESDPDNNVTQYGYNAAGQMTSQTSPLNYQETFAYDAAGELTSQTDYNGQQTQYSYNEAGWKTGETWLNSQNQSIYQATYTYDNAGRLTEDQDPNSIYNYTYNGDGEMTQDVVTYPGVSATPLVTLSYGYDAVINRTSLSDSLGGSVNYTYDAEHKLTNESFALNGTPGPDESFAYDNLQRCACHYGSNGTGDFIHTDYTYSSTGQLTNLTYTDQTTNTTLANYTYGYDAADEVTSYQDANSSLTYSYDKTGQLLSATGTLNGSNYSGSWTYDPNGNRNMPGYQIGTANELLNDGTFTYTYDKNGNTLTKTNTATGDVWSYTWDYHNQMTEAVEKTKGGVVENDEKYTYDVEGRLIGVNVNGTQQRWTVFDGTNAYLDFNGAGTAVTERYVAAPGSYGALFARVSSTGTTDWYVRDKLGSVRLILDSSGNVLDATVYDPWGNVLNESNPTSGDRFKFGSGVYDPIQGTYLFTARWDNPQVGRWESPDPSGLESDGNPYRYVNNTPISTTDSNGQQPYYDEVNALKKDGWEWDTGPEVKQNSRTQLNVDNFKISQKILGFKQEKLVSATFTYYWDVIAEKTIPATPRCGKPLKEDGAMRFSWKESAKVSYSIGANGKIISVGVGGEATSEKGGDISVGPKEAIETKANKEQMILYLQEVMVVWSWKRNNDRPPTPKQEGTVYLKHFAWALLTKLLPPGQAKCCG